MMSGGSTDWQSVIRSCVRCSMRIISSIIVDHHNLWRPMSFVLLCLRVAPHLHPGGGLLSRFMSAVVMG